MKINNESTKESILNRLKRIEGQIRGIQKMVLEERECHEIFQQITAVKSAFNSASILFLKEYVSDCVYHLSDSPEKIKKDELIEDLINMVGKAS